MAKFLDKKEQVIDLKLTSYGHYLFSVGQFNPVYYAFYDRNIIYDGAYAGMTETQNEIQERIKNDTQYLQGLVLFEEIEDPLKHATTSDGTWDSDGDGTDDREARYFEVDVTPTMVAPRKDTFRYTHAIGDSYINGEQQMAPAWKVVALQGRISGSSLMDVKNDVQIPQIDITLKYLKKVEDYNPTGKYLEEDFRSAIATTQPFSDGKVIRFVSEDLLMYVEELNTDILSENYDIEILEIEKDAIFIEGRPEAGSGSYTPDVWKDTLRRRYFAKDHERIRGGMMTEASLKYVDPIDADIRNYNFDYTTASVGYYFDVYRDYQISPDEACKAAGIFNKQTYYIDLDFDCETQAKKGALFADIYGPVTEPEVCP